MCVLDKINVIVWDEKIWEIIFLCIKIKVFFVFCYCRFEEFRIFIMWKKNVIYKVLLFMSCCYEIK